MSSWQSWQVMSFIVRRKLNYLLLYPNVQPSCSETWVSLFGSRLSRFRRWWWFRLDYCEWLSFLCSFRWWGYLSWRWYLSWWGWLRCWSWLTLSSWNFNFRCWSRCSCLSWSLRWCDCFRSNFRFLFLWLRWWLFGSFWSFCLCFSSNFCYCSLFFCFLSNFLSFFLYKDTLNWIISYFFLHFLE